MSAPFPKPCSCCGKQIAAAEWAQLRAVGVVDDGVERLELRDCACGSTLAIVTPPVQCERCSAPLPAVEPGFSVICGACGIEHEAPCHHCGRWGWHREDCPEIG